MGMVTHVHHWSDQRTFSGKILVTRVSTYTLHMIKLLILVLKSVFSLYHVMQENNHLERNAVWKLKEERLELPETDFQIGVTKLIWYVPSQRPILDTLLNCRVKVC